MSEVVHTLAIQWRAPRAMSRKRDGMPELMAEFADAELGDARRLTRLLSMVEAFAAAPDQSLPQIARDDAEQEAIYRFLSNDGVDPIEMLVPHFQATARRSKEYDTVLVIHDVSKILFTLGEDLHEGLGQWGYKQGFAALPALVLSGDGKNRPLGIGAIHSWVHDVDRTRTKKGRTGWGHVSCDHWDESVEEYRRYAPKDVRAIHVADSEGMAQKLFQRILDRKDGFVIRFAMNRTVALESDPDNFVKIGDAANQLEGLIEVTVPVSPRRKGSRDGQHPQRAARVAQLTLSAGRVRMKKCWGLNQTDPDLPKFLDVNLVHVIELNPPEGDKAIQWLLATSEPVGSIEQVKHVVAIYKARWIIEEFFKILKSGCKLESRRLESFDALQRLLSIFLVIAWRILLLRHESRNDPDAPAETVLSPLMLEVLRAANRRPMSAKPTVGEALLALAGLGGHVKSNGPPGCLVLWRGMERLLERTAGVASMRRVNQPRRSSSRKGRSRNLR